LSSYFIKIKKLLTKTNNEIIILTLKVDNEFYNDYIKIFYKESVENYYKYFTKEEQIKRIPKHRNY
jgi:hypothetical protein